MNNDRRMYEDMLKVCDSYECCTINVAGDSLTKTPQKNGNRNKATF